MGLDRRADYDWGELVESDIAEHPVEQLRRWLHDAEEAEVPEPNAMVVATVDATGRPSMRNVLLRGLSDDAVLEFFTNRRSHKGHDIAGNPNVSLLFSWLGLHRQVRIGGVASPLDDARNDEYFATRPRGSQISAWASKQSTVLPDRDALEAAVAEVEARYDGVEVPRPPFWGGYAVRCTEFEFWQGRANRLHDRLHYWRHGDQWRVERLAP